MLFVSFFNDFFKKIIKTSCGVAFFFLFKTAWHKATQCVCANDQSYWSRSVSANIVHTALLFF